MCSIPPGSTYNVIAGGTRLEDIELQRQDEAWMDVLGAEIIPDPTTAGDFLRCFSKADIIELMQAANRTRRKAWNMKAWYGLLTPNKVFGHQIIRMDSSVSLTPLLEYHVSSSKLAVVLFVAL